MDTMLPTIDARDLIDAISRQRDEATNALAAANAMLTKALRDNAEKDRQIAELRSSESS